MDRNRRIADLKTTVSALQTFLDQRISTRDTDTAHLSSQLQWLRTQLNSTLAELQETRNWIAHHDTDDDDAHIGGKAYSHTYSLFSKTPVTPSFHFDITTVFPIRRVDESNIPTTSKWHPKKRQYTEGGVRFVAVLKNKRNASAYAKVDLFGRRKEVHAEELGKRKRRLKELVASSLEQGDLVGVKENELSQFTLAASYYDTHRHLATMDLRQLENAGSASRLSANTFVLCEELGLKSQVWKAHVLDQAVHQTLNSPYAAEFMQSQLTSYTELVRHLRDLLSKLRTQKRHEATHSHAFSERMIERKLSSVVAEYRYSCEVSNAPLLKAQNDGQRSKQDKDILDAAILMLEADATDIESSVEKARQQLALTRQERQSMLLKDGTERHITKMLEEAERDILATKRVLLLLSLEEKAWPISVYACFSGDTTVEDGWMEVWKGAREQLGTT